MPDAAIIDEMIEAVARAGGLTHEQAARAVDGLFRFMASRLPSPLFGELQARLRPGAAPVVEPPRSQPPEPP